MANHPPHLLAHRVWAPLSPSFLVHVNDSTLPTSPDPSDYFLDTAPSSIKSNLSDYILPPHLSHINAPSTDSPLGPDTLTTCAIANTPILNIMLT